MSEFPSVPEQAKNMSLLIADVIKDAIKNNQIFAEKKEQRYRYELCESCEHFEAESKRCKQCGCYMEQKVTFTASKCPVGKW